LKTSTKKTFLNYIYLLKSRDRLCQGCQKEFEFHLESGKPGEKWTHQACTVLEQTDAYGVLTFPGSITKRADVKIFK
jgi:hypothetical protein